METRNNFDKAEEIREVEKKKYLPPEIITYTSEQILEEIGPAQACSPSPCGTP